MAAGSLLDDCRFALHVTRGEPNRTLSKLTGRGAMERGQEGGLPFYYGEVRRSLAPCCIQTRSTRL
jgi:hypothetical protein